MKRRSHRSGEQVFPPERNTEEPTQDTGISIRDKFSSSAATLLEDMANRSAGSCGLSKNERSISAIHCFQDSRRLLPEVCVADLLPSTPFRFISPHPMGLNRLQSLFLDHYLNNFFLKYPTYLDPSNPFLSTLVPLALRSPTVLCTSWLL